MTIEESIDLLDNLVGFVEDNQGNDYDGALILAINTMRKYQKIQEIINHAKGSDGAVKYNWLYEQIGKVVEDGKN